MDKNNIRHRNIHKFKKNRVTDKRLRHLDNKLYHINKKIDLISQRNFILNRIIKDSNNNEKLHSRTNLAKIIKNIKIVGIKTLIFMIYLNFKFANQKKIKINKKISELLQSKAIYRHTNVVKEVEKNQ